MNSPALHRFQLHKRCLFFVLLVFFLSLRSYSQNHSSYIDSILFNLYHSLQIAPAQIRYDSVAPKFRQTVVQYLSSPLTFNHKLDSLETVITIRQSPDKKIKFYSWDEMTGGTLHEINVFAQFKSNGSKISYQQIDTDKETETGGFTDSEIYSIHEIIEQGKVFYVTFGWGTHGGGNQHSIVQVFTLVNNQLIKCKAFHNNQTALVIEYPRVERPELIFDEQNKSISFNEFEYSEENQYAQRTGKRILLHFKNGKFR